MSGVRVPPGAPIEYIVKLCIRKYECLEEGLERARLVQANSVGLQVPRRESTEGAERVPLGAPLVHCTIKNGGTRTPE